MLLVRGGHYFHLQLLFLDLSSMEEAFIHFVWKFQHFRRSGLKTDTGLPIVVFETGYENKDAGPDFKSAKIKIGEMVWNGHIEIHTKASDWRRHKHQQDQAYDNVILHVVWSNDEVVKRNDGTTIPTMEIKNLVDSDLILRYRKLLTPASEILCSSYLPHISTLTAYGMMDKALTARLETKSGIILRDIALTDNNWEEIAWRLVARNFGFRTNADAFGDLAKTLPINILKKESNNLLTVEAMLFGQAGLLDEKPVDDYSQTLQTEYLFKARKYGLERRLHRHQWKFLRLRPANFPTIRIAQLAKLVSANPSLFSLFTAQLPPKELKNAFAVHQSAYWHKHYDFNKPSKTVIGNLGLSSIENILINTAVPLLFAYGIYKDNDELKERSVNLLSEIRAENNRIIRKWKDAGLAAKSAFDSQALIGQFHDFCKKKRCLQCQVGADIMCKAL
jgi:hypothetical protein